MDDTSQATPVAVQRLTADRVFSALGTSQAGLTQEEARARQERQGKNLIQTERKTSPVLAFLSNFTHLMAILLWAAGAIAFVAGLPELGVAVWLVNVINGCFSFWQEYRAGKATDALKKMLPSYATVVRDGQEQRILAEDLVPGDVMVLAEGDKISADARVVRASDLQVNQSTLTGESNPVRKTSDAVLEEDLTQAETPNLISAARRLGRARARRGHAHRHGHGVWQDRPPHAEHAGGREPPAAAAQPHHKADHDLRDLHGRGLLPARRPVREERVRRRVHLLPGHDRGLHPRGAAAHGDALARHGGAAHEQEKRPREEAQLRGDPGLVLGHLHGQDGHAHAERDDGEPPLDREPRVRGHRRGLRARRLRPPGREGRGRPCRRRPATARDGRGAVLQRAPAAARGGGRPPPPCSATPRRPACSSPRQKAGAGPRRAGGPLAARARAALREPPQAHRRRFTSSPSRCDARGAWPSSRARRARSWASPRACGWTASPCP